jgi:hypothetical protein
LVLVPEGRQLFTDMTVSENLEMGASNRRAGPRMKENMDRVFGMFPRLKERREQKAGTLSGGEQQMLAVGRGIMEEPKVLMIDELSLGLAPVLVMQLFERLRLRLCAFRREGGDGGAITPTPERSARPRCIPGPIAALGYMMPCALRSLSSLSERPSSPV